MFIKIFTLVTLCVVSFGFAAKLGLDSYEIYLNEKLVLKQSVNQPLHLRVLQLNDTNKNEQLRISFKHCTLKGAGTDGSILMQDETGKILRKWTFANTRSNACTFASQIIVKGCRFLMAPLICNFIESDYHGSIYTSMEN